MRWIALALWLLATPVWAADGDSCPVNPIPPATGNQYYGGGAQKYGCMKLCDNKTNANPLTCGPVPWNPDAISNLCFIQTTGGCTFTNIAVGMNWDTVTGATVATKVIGVLDQNLVVNGVTGQTAVIWPYRPLPYAYVSAGVLSGCSTATFAVWCIQTFAK